MIRSVKLRRAQAGLSLVELMVALMLGLLLMTGIIQVFLSSRQTYATNEAMARMQENGRFALEFIARSARMAGYVEPIYKGDKPLPLVRVNCTGLNAVPSELCTSEGNGNVSDSVGFIMQAPLIDGKRRDCTGKTKNADNTDINDSDLIITTYSIDLPTRNLGCRSYNLTAGKWTTGPTLADLIEGVDNMQVLYGVDTGGDSRSANQYVSANRVGGNLKDWQRVRAVRIAVLTNSIAPVTPAPANRQFVLLDAAPLAAANLGDDNRARQIFTTTIQLKNTD